MKRDYTKSRKSFITLKTELSVCEIKQRHTLKSPTSWSHHAL